MRVAQRMAGYSAEEADNLRKACAKKIRELIVPEREKFVRGCLAQGYDEALATRLFDIIEPFADYAFNKPHAYGYGLIAYQTAWCKVHFPVEYLSALLTSVRDDKDRTAVYLAECRSLGIEVAVPDVNSAMADFTPSAHDRRVIVFGLAAVRNVGESLVDRIVGERVANGPFATVYDFVRRVDPIVLNKRTMESLIKGGAFDSFGVPRKGLYLVVEELVARTLERRREHDAGIATLFAAAAEEKGEGEGTWEGTELPIPDQEFSKNERLRFEKEMLGLYVSDHPLLGAAGMLARHTDHTIAEAKELAELPHGDGGVVRVGGVVTDVQRRFSKRGEEWARFTLEDLGGAIEVLCFAKPFHDFGALLEADAVVVVAGRLDTREDAPKLVVISVSTPRLEPGDDVLKIRLPLGVVTESFVGSLKGVLKEHPGESPVQLLLVGAEERTIQLPRRVLRRRPRCGRGAAHDARPRRHRRLTPTPPRAHDGAVHVPAVDRPLDDDEWRGVRRRAGLRAPGRVGCAGVTSPVVVPTQFVLDGDEVLCHVAAANPVLARARRAATAVLRVAGDWAFVPSSWKAIDDEDPRLGIPTTYYAAVQLAGHRRRRRGPRRAGGSAAPPARGAAARASTSPTPPSTTAAGSPPSAGSCSTSRTWWPSSSTAATSTSRTVARCSSVSRRAPGRATRPPRPTCVAGSPVGSGPTAFTRG